MNTPQGNFDEPQCEELPKENNHLKINDDLSVFHKEDVIGISVKNLITKKHKIVYLTEHEAWLIAEWIKQELD